MRRLLIFLKFPKPGRVKTRLAAQIGDEAACGIYQACIELTLERLRVFQEQTILCLEPAEAIDPARTWLGEDWRIQPQRGSTLGDRLIQATLSAFAEGARQVVVIGTDSPWLAPQDIDAAFLVLNQQDVVVGPTDDGGYYLLGSSRPFPSLFGGIAWSTAAVLAQTQARVTALGLAMHTLEAGYDLDFVADVEKFINQERARGVKAAAVEKMSQLLHEGRQPCQS